MTAYHSLPEDWESRLEYRLLYCRENQLQKKAYICSPCRGKDLDEACRNMRAARYYMLYANQHMSFLARAPHAYMPLLLSDGIPYERSLAFRFGQEFIGMHDEILVCGAALTSGMRGEIETAAKLNQAIQVFDPEVLIEARKIVTGMGIDKHLVGFNQAHPTLGLSPASLIEKGAA